MSKASFKKIALDNIMSILDSYGIETDCEEQGMNESYLHLKSHEKDLSIWIYNDEVGFRIGETHIHCEKQDFDTQEEILSFFEDRLRGLISN